MQLVDDTLVKNIIHQKMRDEWPKDKDFQAILGISEDTDQNNDAYEEKLNKVAKDIENILINAIPKYYLTFENENSKEEFVNFSCNTDNFNNMFSSNAGICSR